MVHPKRRANLTSDSSRVFRWVLGLSVVSAFIISLGGCSNPSEASRQQMHDIQLALMEYAETNDGEWPDSLDQIKDKIGGDAKFSNLMKNPLTGSDPGYEYVKPKGN